MIPLERFSHTGQGVKVIDEAHPCANMDGRVTRVCLSGAGTSAVGTEAWVRINEGQEPPPGTFPFPEDPARDRWVKLDAPQCAELEIPDAEDKAKALRQPQGKAA